MLQDSQLELRYLVMYEPSVLSTQEDGIKSLNTGGGGGATGGGGGAKALSGTR